MYYNVSYDKVRSKIIHTNVKVKCSYLNQPSVKIKNKKIIIV